MIPSVFALIVLAGGLILIHFGIKEVEAQLGQIVSTPTPNVTTTGSVTAADLAAMGYTS